MMIRWSDNKAANKRRQNWLIRGQKFLDDYFGVFLAPPDTADLATGIESFIDSSETGVLSKISNLDTGIISAIEQNFGIRSFLSSQDTGVESKINNDPTGIESEIS